MTETTKPEPISEARLDELIAGAEFRIKHDIAVERGMEDWLSALRELQALRQENEWISVTPGFKTRRWGIVVIAGVVQNTPAILEAGKWLWLDEDADPAPFGAVSHFWPLPAPPAPRTEEKP